MSTITERIQELENEILKLREAEKREKALTLEQRIAIILHSDCRYAHEDQCGWYYGIRNDIHDWNESTHSDYLAKARKVVANFHANGVNSEEAILNLVRGFKY